MVESIVANPGIVNTTLSLYQMLYTYMEEAGILENELNGILNWRLKDNQAILGLVQAKALERLGGDRRDEFLDTTMTVEKVSQTFSFQEAQRYSKYAIAAYGDSLIKAADLDAYMERLTFAWANGRLDASLNMLAFPKRT